MPELSESRPDRAADLLRRYLIFRFTQLGCELPLRDQLGDLFLREQPRTRVCNARQEWIFSKVEYQPNVLGACFSLTGQSVRALDTHTDGREPPESRQRTNVVCNALIVKPLTCAACKLHPNGLRRNSPKASEGNFVDDRSLVNLDGWRSKLRVAWRIFRSPRECRAPEQRHHNRCHHDL